MACSVGAGAGGSEAGDTAAGHHHAVQPGHVEPYSGAAGDGGESGDRSEALRLTGPAIETWQFEAGIDAATRFGRAAPGGFLPRLAVLELLIHPGFPGVLGDRPAVHPRQRGQQAADKDAIRRGSARANRPPSRSISSSNSCRQRSRSTLRPAAIARSPVVHTPSDHRAVAVPRPTSRSAQSRSVAGVLTDLRKEGSESFAILAILNPSANVILGKRFTIAEVEVEVDRLLRALRRIGEEIEKKRDPSRVSEQGIQIGSEILPGIKVSQEGVPATSLGRLTIVVNNRTGQGMSFST